MNRQSTMSNSGDWLFRSIKQNPEGLLLVAAGAALLMRSVSSSGAKASRTNRSEGSMSDAAERAADSMTDTMSNATDHARGTISDMAGQAKDKVSGLASSAQDFASQASDKASQAARTVGDKATNMARQTKSTTQDYASRMLEEQPLVIAVAGLAAGAALAAAFPGTQMEKETLGPIGEQVSDAAQRVGDQLKDATAAAGESLKNAARERGLNQDGLKEVATEAAEAFSNRMSGREEPAGSTGGKQEAPATTDPRF